MRPWLVLACAAGCACAADWLTDGGDPSRDNWQRRENTLKPENVKDLKLLWKQTLGAGPLSAPVILGPIITHRGIKELVLVESAGNGIFAIDADLGRTFWTRNLAPDAPACKSAPATPVITPEAVPTKEDGEGHTPMRPIYFAAGDGSVHKVSPSTGDDMDAPQKRSGGCSDKIQMGSFVSPGMASFVWKGRKLLIGAGADVNLPGPVATWEAPGGTRWMYSAGPDSLQAWTFDGSLSKQWNKPGLGAPVIANGMLFALGSGSLHVLEAVTGRELVAIPAAEGGSLALANGHICFTSANVLYCFGLPLEI